MAKTLKGLSHPEYSGRVLFLLCRGKELNLQALASASS
jgi:hypothetical protein